MFKAPKLELERARVLEIPFFGTVGAGAFLTLLTSRITFPFRVIQVKMIFTPDANNVVEHRWFVAKNAAIDATGFPSAENIFRELAPTAGFIGDAIIRICPVNIEYLDPPYYIKLGVNNGLAAAYIINAAITIEEI